MRCRWTGSWRRGLVAGSAGGEREGTAKNRPRHYPQRGQAGAGASAAGACRAATAGIRQGGRWELRNGRRLRSAKQAPRPSELLHARPGKFLKTESKVHLKVETFLLLLHATRGLFFLFFGPQFLLSSPWIFLLSSFFFFFFPFSFSYSLRSPLCGTTPTPFFSSSNILLNFKSQKKWNLGESLLFNFFPLNELVSRGGRARAKKKTREVCSALKQR